MDRFLLLACPPPQFLLLGAGTGSGERVVGKGEHWPLDEFKLGRAGGESGG